MKKNIAAGIITPHMSDATLYAGLSEPVPASVEIDASGNSEHANGSALHADPEVAPCSALR